MAKKNTWIKVLAGIGLAVGAGAAVATIVKKKSEKISEELDFDNSVYFEDESMLEYDDDDTIDDLDGITDEAVALDKLEDEVEEIDQPIEEIEQAIEEVHQAIEEIVEETTVEETTVEETPVEEAPKKTRKKAHKEDCIKGVTLETAEAVIEEATKIIE